MTEASYHIETSPLIWRANQWTGFYMIGTSVMKFADDLSVNWAVLLSEGNKLEIAVKFCF